MSLTDSPSFGDGSENAPLKEQPPSGQPPESKPPSRVTRTRIVIALLFVAVLVTGIVFALQRINPPQTLTGSVTVIGQVVDPQGNPIQNAEVYVEGLGFAVNTNESGNFSISGAVDGQVIVVVAVTPQPPHFEVVTAQANETKDLG